MPEYVHAHGPRELTVAGSTRDRELAAKAADGRTNWNLAPEWWTDTSESRRMLAEERAELAKAEADATEPAGE